MFAVLVISAKSGSWAADHTSQLRAWTCTPTRLAYHMCEANTGGANATGTGYAAATPDGETQINRCTFCSCQATLICTLSFELRGLTDWLYLVVCSHKRGPRPLGGAGEWQMGLGCACGRHLGEGDSSDEASLLPNGRVYRDSGGRWTRQRGMATGFV